VEAAELLDLTRLQVNIMYGLTFQGGQLQRWNLSHALTVDIRSSMQTKWVFEILTPQEGLCWVLTRHHHNNNQIDEAVHIVVHN
jgi:hypothetical protein